MPTGGISMKNAADYLALPYVVCCGASFIASDEQIGGGRFDEITEAARQAKELADSIREH
jgi:2-dehydro-3-deoxyphosphogluconate aldolase/(4S)-4-hydroxy-2-oxoglutarate aldolase